MPEWTLPDSPSDRRYKAFYREVKENPNRRIAYAILARVAEADFYAFARYVSSFGNYPIRDRGHSRFGKLWVDEPFVFEKCRELQADSENAVDDKFYNWSRFFFKCLAIDTPVPTIAGWKAHGDLQPNDEVFAIDGSPTRIIGASRVYEEKETFRVHFDDGASLVSSWDHLWTVEVPDKRRSDGNGQRFPNRNRRRRVEIWTTRRLYEHEHHADNRIRVPKQGAAAHLPAELPIDPYVLGVWLGDGTRNGGRVTNVDEQVWGEIRATGYHLGKNLCPRAETHTIYGLEVQLRALGCLEDKRIPESYLVSGIEQRRALLQGLMDTDGTCSDGRATFSNTNHQLILSVARLARSLGFKARIYGPYDSGCMPFWHVYFRVQPEDRVFRLERKLTRGQTAPPNRWRAIVDVEKIDSVESSCVMIAHPSQTYLVGESYTPTHNTELVTKLLSLWELLKDPTLTFAIITHKVDQAGLQIFRGPQGEMEQNPLLPACWPAIFLPDYRDYKLWTITACTILRQPGIREPTFSIHGLDNLPDSGHYRRLIPDDAITARAVENPRSIAKAERQMRRITPLSQDDTVTRWVGTVWDENDPNMQWVKKGLFSGGRDHEPGLQHPKRIPWSTNAKLEEWTPQLRSLAFFSKWRRKLGEYEFSCQVMGAPVARSEQNFDLEWIKEYDTPIREQAKKCRVQLILDPAGERNEEKDETDYWVWRVLGPGADGNMYHFDLWRERATLVEALDLTFALVKHWKPEQVWVEDYSSGTFAAIRREMELRAYRFRLRKLPQIKRSKESRIKLLQAPYQRGSIWYPREGFNHGSGPFYQDMIRVATEPGGEFTPRSKVVDKRDTYQQFREDEYTRWVPIKGVVIHDDMLDCEAWAFQEEVRTLMPKPERLESVVNFNPHAEHQRGINRSYEPSAWVF